MFRATRATESGHVLLEAGEKTQRTLRASAAGTRGVGGIGIRVPYFPRKALSEPLDYANCIRVASLREPITGLCVAVDLLLVPQLGQLVFD